MLDLGLKSARSLDRFCGISLSHLSCCRWGGGFFFSSRTHRWVAHDGMAMLRRQGRSGPAGTLSAASASGPQSRAGCRDTRPSWWTCRGRTVDAARRPMRPPRSAARAAAAARASRRPSPARRGPPGWRPRHGRRTLPRRSASTRDPGRWPASPHSRPPPGLRRTPSSAGRCSRQGARSPLPPTSRSAPTEPASWSSNHSAAPASPLGSSVTNTRCMPGRPWSRARKAVWCSAALVSAAAPA